MTDIQKVRFNEPSSPRPVEHEKREVQSNEAGENVVVKRLDGQVMKPAEVAFAGGTYCEVWVGQWHKPGEKEGGGEKVRLSLPASTQLTWFFVGGLESTSSAQVNSLGEGA